MADGSKIEWTDATWNPVTGCSVVSPGCTNCYAMRLAGSRMKHHPSRKGLTDSSKAGPVWNGQVRFNEQWLDQPLRWKKPRRIFVCAHGDLFHENVPDEWIDRVFAVMALSPHHQFQVLTKRADRMRAYLAFGAGYRERLNAIGSAVLELDDERVLLSHALPLPNVWLGVSVEDQARAKERIPALLETPAAVRFVSAEPLLGPIDFQAIWARRSDGVETLWDALTPPGVHHHPDNDPANPHVQTVVRAAQRAMRPTLDWVIAGGESGPGARKMELEWARSILEQCKSAGVSVFMKQLGACASDPVNGLAGAKLAVDPAAAPLIARRLRDSHGGDWDEWPADLRVREFPV